MYKRLLNRIPKLDDSRAMIMQVNTELVGQTANNQFALPLRAVGTIELQVYWGDGQVTNINDYTEAKHTYADPGIYDVKVFPVADGVQHLKWTNQYAANTFKDGNKILQISQFGDITMFQNSTALSRGLFFNCQNLEITAPDLKTRVIDPSNNLISTFLSCKKIKTLPDFANFNMSNKTSINGAFNQCDLDATMDANSWDVSNVTDFNRAFQLNNNFNPNLSNWNIAAATDMYRIFHGTPLTQANWDSMLIAWNNLANTPQNIDINAVPANYTLGGAADAARTNLINAHGWTINDNGGV